jgi:glycosyltransferase involved in cell wall biosynthesis
MKIVHLTASTFYGGPERQMLGLASALPEGVETLFLSFAEGGRCRAFLSAARQRGFDAQALENDTPHFRATIAEIAAQLERVGADVLFCHGYKADILGRWAARRLKVPVVAVSRGWTGESFRVRLYESLDRWLLGGMDRVVCVSEAQARKCRKAGVRANRLRVIHNAVDPERFDDPDPACRTKLARYFRGPRVHIVGAAGRLSPEKGFDVLVAAAERVLRTEKSVGFILFGDGPCRAKLSEQINDLGLAGSFVLGGFRADLDRFLPFFDLMVLPSHTEGLPNVVLEAFAAGVPVVATAVGGTPEVVEDGQSGFLVPPGDPETLAERILDLLAAEDQLRDMGLHGRERVLEQFSFAAQADQYLALCAELLPAPPPEPEPEPEPGPASVGEEVPAASLSHPDRVAALAARGVVVVPPEEPPTTDVRSQRWGKVTDPAMNVAEESCEP